MAPVFAQSQDASLNGNVLSLPVVIVGQSYYRVELTLVEGTDPIELLVTLGEEVFNVDPGNASTFSGNNLSVPSVIYDGESYSIEMALIEENPPRFRISSVAGVLEDPPPPAPMVFTTFSPNACTADIQLLREEDFTPPDHPLGYKGQMFENRYISTPDGNRHSIISLTSDAQIVTAWDSAPDMGQGAQFILPADEIAIAEDHGDENDPDYPIAFKAQVRVDGFTTRRAIYRTNPAGELSRVIAEDDILQLDGVGGTVESFSDLSLSRDGTLFFSLMFEQNAMQYLVMQDTPASSIVLLLAEGEFLNTGEETTTRTAGQIDKAKPNHFSQARVNVEVKDENGLIEGFAELYVDTTTGSDICAATDSSLVCGGLQVSNSQSLGSFSSDGSTFGGVVSSGAENFLSYKTLVNPISEEIYSNVPFQGHTFTNFKFPRVCEHTNALYFIGTKNEPGIGIYDEVMQINENGVLTQISDFRSLLADPSLQGEVPDEVRNWDLGFNCDAVLYTHGPSSATSSNSYLAYWGIFHDQVMEIMDETPGRPNGNGSITDVSAAVSALDGVTTEGAQANIGPAGEFYFVPRIKNDSGSYIANYARATKPAACQ